MRRARCLLFMIIRSWHALRNNKRCSMRCTAWISSINHQVPNAKLNYQLPNRHLMSSDQRSATKLCYQALLPSLATIDQSSLPPTKAQHHLPKLSYQAQLPSSATKPNYNLPQAQLQLPKLSYQTQLPSTITATTNQSSATIFDDQRSAT